MFPRVFSVMILILMINTNKGLNITTKVDVSRNNECILRFEDSLLIKLKEYVKNITRYLEDFNGRNWGKSALGKLLHYENIKPKRSAIKPTGRMKKMDVMAMMPLVFQIGAASTWIMISAIMSIKSVMIGLTLLVFKIAAGSAKLAALFTKWKNDQHHEQSSWEKTSAPHYEYEYHGHYADQSGYASPDASEWHSYYHPEWIPNDQDYYPPSRQ